MRLIALVGKSGTGKSFKAIDVCKDKDIDGIIDDGLFIFRGQIASGHSAKKDKTKIGAIKTALFVYDKHADEVIKSIKNAAPSGILIIGTSVGMVEKIRKKLKLPEFSEYVYIEDVTTERERLTANKQRKNEGKHAVPAPTFELKHHFSGYFVHPIKKIKGKNSSAGKNEKAVVRPIYSYLGDYKISDRVIERLIKKAFRDNEPAGNINIIYINSKSTGLYIAVQVVLRKGISFICESDMLQTAIKNEVEKMTAINVEQVDITIRGIVDSPKGRLTDGF